MHGWIQKHYNIFSHCPYPVDSTIWIYFLYPTLRISKSHEIACASKIHFKIYKSHEGIWGSTNNRNSKSLYYGLVIQSLDLHNSFPWIAICSLDLLNSVFSSCNSFPQIVPLIYIIRSARLKLQSKGTNCVNRWNE